VRSLIVFAEDQVSREVLMSLMHVPFDEVTESSLRQLIADEVVESRTIEYKELVPDTRDGRKDFLADVSSFANAVGGDLVLGVRESGGRPVALVGLGNRDQIDDEKQRVENLLRDGIDPPLSLVQMKDVLLETGSFCLVLRIPRSWHPPHMVALNGRFYSRNSVGKYPLDVSELRQIFARNETTAERIRRFRAERLAKIVAAETPCPLKGTGRVVVHVIPLSSADPLGPAIDVRDVGQKDPAAMPLLRGGGFNQRYNADGFLNYYDGWGYSQLFRNGAIEGVDAGWLLAAERQQRALPGEEFERQVLGSIRQYMEVQEKRLKLHPPTAALLSLLAVRGFSVLAGPGRLGIPIEVSDVLVPEAVIDAPAYRFPDSAVKPLFDVVWNASGYEGSPNFDIHGDWNPRS
jgi:hypothetical protein